jgi:hypothetical protein
LHDPSSSHASGFQANRLLAVRLHLIFSQFFQHSHASVGLDQFLPTTCDFNIQCLLLLPQFGLSAVQGFAVLLAFGQTHNVNRTRLGNATALLLQGLLLCLQPHLPGAEFRIGAVGVGQFHPAGIARGVAQPQQSL